MQTRGLNGCIILPVAAAESGQDDCIGQGEALFLGLTNRAFSLLLRYCRRTTLLW